MARSKSSLLKDLSTADLKRLLAARERIDVLESEKTKLAKELARIEKELARVVADSGLPGPSRRGRKKITRRKTARKKAVRKVAAKKKTTAAKKVVKKKPAKKMSKKKVTKKKVTKKKAVKKRIVKKTGKTAARAVKGGRVRLEDVIAQVIKKHGGKMPFQDLKAAIVKGKLFRTKSTNFDNVLRRTLSTSAVVTRAGRGIYKLA